MKVDICAHANFNDLDFDTRSQCLSRGKEISVELNKQVHMTLAVFCFVLHKGGS